MGWSLRFRVWSCLLACCAGSGGAGGEARVLGLGVGFRRPGFNDRVEVLLMLGCCVGWMVLEVQVGLGFWAAGFCWGIGFSVDC
jgi:hypothetical protein